MDVYRYRATLPRYATVAAYTGPRCGELAGLQNLNIERPRERLNVRTSLFEASGQPPFLGSPKTDSSKRTITRHTHAA